MPSSGRDPLSGFPTTECPAGVQARLLRRIIPSLAMCTKATPRWFRFVEGRTRRLATPPLSFVVLSATGEISHCQTFNTCELFAVVWASFHSVVFFVAHFVVFSVFIVGIAGRVWKLGLSLVPVCSGLGRVKNDGDCVDSSFFGFIHKI